MFIAFPSLRKESGPDSLKRGAKTTAWPKASQMAGVCLVSFGILLSACGDEAYLEPETERETAADADLRRVFDAQPDTGFFTSNKNKIYYYDKTNPYDRWIQPVANEFPLYTCGYPRKQHLAVKNARIRNGVYLRYFDRDVKEAHPGCIVKAKRPDGYGRTDNVFAFDWPGRKAYFLDLKTGKRHHIKNRYALSDCDVGLGDHINKVFGKGTSERFPRARGSITGCNSRNTLYRADYKNNRAGWQSLNAKIKLWVFNNGGGVNNFLN